MCVQVEDLELTAVVLDAPDCPREAVHGSYMRNWPSIRSKGLCRMNRTHIHLAPGLPGEDQVISGASHRAHCFSVDLKYSESAKICLVFCFLSVIGVMYVSPKVLSVNICAKSYRILK